MKLLKPLISENLFFRTLTNKDVGAKYLKWLQDKRLTKYLEVRFEHQTKQKIKKYIEKCNKSYDTILIGIFLRKQKTHIGNIKICSISWHHKHCTVGILIGDRHAHNQGNATESISRITQFCRIQLKMKKVSAGLYKSNIPSHKAFRKSGFFIEAVLKKHWKEGKKWVDGLLMAKTF